MGRVKFFFSLARRAWWNARGMGRVNFFFSGEEGDDGTHVAWEG